MSCRKALTEFRLATSNLLSRSRVSGQPLYGRTFWYYYAQARTIPILLLTFFWISNGALYWQTCTHSSARCYSLSLPQFHYNRSRTCLTPLSGKPVMSRTSFSFLTSGCNTPDSARPTIISAKPPFPRTSFSFLISGCRASCSGR